MVFLALMTVILFSQVVARYVFSSGLSWAEEMVRYLCVWMIFLGASCATKNGSQIAVTALEEALPSAPRKILTIFQHIIVAIYTVLVTWIGYLALHFASMQSSPNMRIPMNIIYSVIPISMVIMILHLLSIFISLSKKNQVQNVEGGK